MDFCDPLTILRALKKLSNSTFSVSAICSTNRLSPRLSSAPCHTCCLFWVVPSQYGHLQYARVRRGCTFTNGILAYLLRLSHCHKFLSRSIAPWHLKSWDPHSNWTWTVTCSLPPLSLDLSGCEASSALHDILPSKLVSQWRLRHGTKFVRQYEMQAWPLPDHSFFVLAIEIPRRIHLNCASVFLITTDFPCSGWSEPQTLNSKMSRNDLIELLRHSQLQNPALCEMHFSRIVKLWNLNTFSNSKFQMLLISS